MAGMARVLLVEDQIEVANALGGFLQQYGYAVTHASTGLVALEHFFASQFDVLLLDIMLPGITGLEVLRQVRSQSQVPVLVVTARSDEREILEGFSLGADDYIQKPFRMLEVLARLQAVLRRSQSHTSAVLMLHDLKLDLAERSAMQNGKKLDFTSAEFELLLRFLQHPNRVFTRSELVDCLGREDTLERTVDTHIKNLRRKLGEQHRISTVFGVGYRYAA